MDNQLVAAFWDEACLLMQDYRAGDIRPLPTGFWNTGIRLVHWCEETGIPGGVELYAMLQTLRRAANGDHVAVAHMDFVGDCADFAIGNIICRLVRVVPNLQPEHLEALQFLREHDGCKQRSFWTGTTLGEREAKRVLAELEQWQLLGRPQGPKSGYRITAAGRQALACH